MLGHLALRRAAMERLRPSGTPAEGPWPTIAADRVFDSQFDPIEGMLGAEPLATILIYTEDVDAPGGSSTNGVPHQPVVSLVIELANVSAVKEATARGPGISFAYPLTDPVLEASIDVLASQVCRRLVLEPGAAFKAARRKVEKYSSTPFRDGEGGRRIALRALTLACALPTATAEVEAAEAVLALLPPGSDSAGVLAAALSAVQATAGFDAAPSLLAGTDVTIRSSTAQAGTPDILATIPASAEP